MERQSERWGPRDRPETGRGALYKRAADLVATYEELLLVPDEACVTHYLGDLGIHILNMTRHRSRSKTPMKRR